MQGQGSFTVNEVKKRLSLSSVVRQAVQLKGNGPKFLGLCPFHQEKTPSFHVQDTLGRYKCFGCGASGDVFEFIMRLRGLTFKEAVAELADRCGLSTSPTKAQSQAHSNDPARELLKAQKVAHQFFIAQLKSARGTLAREYLMQKRHLSSSMIDQAALGYGGDSSGEFFSALKNSGLSKESALKAGLVKEQGSKLVPVFLGRIIFPIRRFDGKVIAFGGRSLSTQDDAPKYVNTHAYILYEKRKNFYGLWESKTAILKGQTPVLVEGYFDAMAIWAAGLPALALCGTALSKEHAIILKKLCARLIICFDDDEAGYKATRAALSLLVPRNITASVVSLDKKDPGEYLADLSALRKRLEKPEDALCSVIDRAALNAEGDISERIVEIDQLMPLLSSISRPLMRRQYVVYLAKKLHEDVSLLWSEICRGLKNKQIKEREPEPQAAPETLVLNPTHKLVAQILSAFPLLASRIPPLVQAYLPEKFSEHVLKQSEENRALLQALKAEQGQSISISLAEAEAVLQALDKRVAKLNSKAQLKLNRQELQQAEKAKDFSSVLKSLKEQSQILAQNKPVKAVELKNNSEPPPLSPPLKPITKSFDYLEEEDWL